MTAEAKTLMHALIPGLVLIVLGALILLVQLDVFELGWFQLYPLILVALGILFFTLSFSRREWGSLFPGTLFLSLGVFFLLRNFDLIRFYELEQVWPAILVALGLAFVALFIAMPRDWGVMIPGSIFLFFGVVLFIDRIGIYWWWWELAERYWALILVSIGLSILVSSLVRQHVKS